MVAWSVSFWRHGEIMRKAIQIPDENDNDGPGFYRRVLHELLHLKVRTYGGVGEHDDAWEKAQLWWWACRLS